MTRESHTHPCAYAPHCTTLVDCGGTLRRNHDGWPEVVCDSYHTWSGGIDAVPCAECEEAMCRACGCNVRIDGHSFDCSQILIGDWVQDEEGRERHRRAS